MCLIYELITRHFWEVFSFLTFGILVCAFLLLLMRRSLTVESLPVQTPVVPEDLPKIFSDRDSLRRAVEMEIDQYLNDGRPRVMFQKSLHQALSAEDSISESRRQRNN